MGAWGYGVRDDDFVADVIGIFDDHLKEGADVAAATTAVKAKFAGASEDPVDGPLFWIALADRQWTYGALEPEVLQRVREDFGSGRSLAAWSEDARGLARRRTALEKFLEKIATPNPKPKKPPRTIIRAPKFEAGDCLSIRLGTGDYTAALVLAANHSAVEYGTNLIGLLDYLSSDKPPLHVFRERQWLMVADDRSKDQPHVAWYYPMGFRTVKSRLELVGRVEILEADPRDSRSHYRWEGIGEQVIRQRGRR